MVSTGCIRAQESAHERPPAKADFRTLPAGISIGGATATTVAASNQILLYILENKLILGIYVHRFEQYIYHFQNCFAFDVKSPSKAVLLGITCVGSTNI